MEQIKRIISHSYTSFMHLFVSRKFFYFIVFCLIFESIWIALSAQYPMAFDEAFHFGIIQIYAQRLNPFLTGQPANANIFGALARDPSYLYHFLMSFPFRVINVFSQNLHLQVLLLRLLNVGIFTAGVGVFYTLFTRFTKVPKTLIHFLLLVFVLTPIVPLVAGQINYDNLLFLGTATSLYFTMQFLDQLRNHHLFAIKSLVILLAICLLTSIVKYAYLPIFLGILVIVCIEIALWFRTEKGSVWPKLKFELERMSLATKIGIFALFLLSNILFFQRYGLNVLKYHTPIPDCGQVLSTEDCLQYSPWARNYQYALLNQGGVPTSISQFTDMWVHNMVYGLFFTINTDFNVAPPLQTPFTAAKALGLVGFLLVAIYAWKLYKTNYAFLLFFSVIVIYVATLWQHNYSEFIRFGVPVAEQGRYLLPILLPLYLIIGYAFKLALDALESIKPVVALAVLFLFLQGGGFMTFILRSDQSWYWPNPIITSVNISTQNWLKMVIKG